MSASETNIIKCNRHEEKYLNFACLNKECMNVRYGCFSCMQEHHQEHLKDIKEFDGLKKDIQIGLQANEVIINKTLNFFYQALRNIQKIKEQFDCSKELLNKFSSYQNRKDINNATTELIFLQQGKYQKMIQKMIENVVIHIDELKINTKKSLNIEQVRQEPYQGEIKQVTIEVQLEVLIQAAKIQIGINVDPHIPFFQFAEEIKEQILNQINLDQQDEKIEYWLGQQLHLEKEPRTLSLLGFTNRCTLQIRLALREGPREIVNYD